MQTGAPACTEPTTRVECVEATEASLLLAWQDVTGAVKYQLEWRVQGEGDFQPLGAQGFGSGMPPKLKKGLASGTAYEFRVRARDAVDWHPWGPTSAHTTLSLGAKRMAPPTASASDESSITVVWEPVDEASHYELQMREASTPSWVTVSSTITGHAARKKNLDGAESRFCFRVRPSRFDAQEGESSSSEWSFSPSSAELGTAAVSPFLGKLFGQSAVFTNAAGATVSLAKLAGSVVAVYFSAHWCPPCRQFTPMLARLYNKAREEGRRFEVVFVSSDRDPQSMNEYLKEMPWLAVAFADPLRNHLQSTFQVNGIPNLKVFSPSGKLVDDNAVQSGKLSLNAIAQWEKL